MRSITVVLFAIMIAPCLAAETLSIEILDMPDAVWSPSPVFLTVAITNHGIEGLLVPVNHCCSGNRFVVETALLGEDFEVRSSVTGSVTSDSVIWLEAEEQWLVRFDIGRWIVSPGDYQIRIGLRSSGECVVASSQSSAIPTEPTKHHHPLAILTYDCWSGMLQSDIVNLTCVSPPSKETDAAALAWLNSESFPGLRIRRGLRTQLSQGYPWLKMRFPNSHYTYVGGLYGAADAIHDTTETFQEILRLQPNHPLTRYTRLEFALMKLRVGVPFSASDEKESLPEPLAAYWEQTYRIQFPAESEASTESQGGSKRTAGF